jgi:phosphoribosylformylglycinamidine cyclo-ligase
MGRISERDMFNTFNMGIGMSLVVRPEKADAVQAAIPDAVKIGEITAGESRIVLE